MNLLRTILQEELKFLTFRPLGPAIRRHPTAFLVFGLVCAWLAGVGRYWDHPTADTWQRLGLGSVAYVFVMAAFIWLVTLPLKPRIRGFLTYLVFVAMTSPPALLYAIPVERFTSMGHATNINAWFLAIVAAWRVALLVHFLRHATGLSKGVVFVAAILPLALIVVTLSMLNLQHAVFDVMAGSAGRERTSEDSVHVILFLLSALSFITSPGLLIAYMACIFEAQASGKPTGVPAETPPSSEGHSEQNTETGI